MPSFEFALPPTDSALSAAAKRRRRCSKDPTKGPAHQDRTSEPSPIRDFTDRRAVFSQELLGAVDTPSDHELQWRYASRLLKGSHKMKARQIDERSELRNGDFFIQVVVHVFDDQPHLARGETALV